MTYVINSNMYTQNGNILTPPHNLWDSCCICMGQCKHWFFLKHTDCGQHPCWCHIDNLTYIEWLAKERNLI